MLGISTITEPRLFIAPKKLFVQTLYPNEYSYNQFSLIQNSRLPPLLCFHDSQGIHYLNDYLSMNFEKSHFIHLEGAPQYLSQEAIRQLNPDVVIIEIVKRDLDPLADILSNFRSK